MRRKSVFRLPGPGLLLTLALAFTLWGVDLLREHRLRIFSGLYGFARREPFSLLDSLPALSPGLSDLEAYKLTADATSKTNADRSIWLSDSLGTVHVEFYSAKKPLDSATLWVWTSSTGGESRGLAGACSLRWDIPVHLPIEEWEEVVGIYRSYPRRLNFVTGDPSLRLWEEVEGKTLHVVHRRYRDLPEVVTPADTSYPVTDGGDVRLLSRGDAVALVNPSPRPVRFRIIRLRENRWSLCEAKARSINIYRRFLTGTNGPLLAYSNPGKPFPVGRNVRNPPSHFFWLDPRP